MGHRASPTVTEVLHEAVRWARDTAGLQGIALVGSYAHGTASAQSDIDLVILAEERDAYFDDRGWLQRFGPVKRELAEEWGVLRSLRVIFKGGQEVEFGFAPPSWAALPVDAGTQEVVRCGLRIVYDPQGLLERLVAAVGRQPR